MKDIVCPSCHKDINSESLIGTPNSFSGLLSFVVVGKLFSLYFRKVVFIKKGSFLSVYLFVFRRKTITVLDFLPLFQDRYQK